jgi:hypothetical protein
MASIRSEIVAASESERKRTGYFEKRPDPRFSEAEISEIEAEIKEKLPESFKEFLLEHGEMMFELGEFAKVKVYFDVNQTELVQEAALSYLGSKDLILRDWKAYALEHEYIEDIGPRIPPQMLPIGRALMRRDAILLLNLSEKNNGSIWIWDGPDETWGTGENRFIGYVASSIDAMFPLIEHGDLG